MDFKKKYTLDERKKESNRIRSKYLDRVPIIVDLHKDSKLPKLDKNKYLVPNDISIGQFLYVIRKRVQIGEYNALFIFINNQIPNHTDLVSELYNRHKDADGFLYVTINDEVTFG